MSLESEDALRHILLVLAGELDVESVCTCACATRTLRRLAREDAVWNAACKARARSSDA